MRVQEELKSLADNIHGMQFVVPRSRNRHRELNNTFEEHKKKLTSIAEHIEALQEACDTNMTLFESLIDLFERKHIVVADDCPKDIADFARDLFGSMRSLLDVYKLRAGDLDTFRVGVKASTLAGERKI